MSELPPPPEPIVRESPEPTPSGQVVIEKYFEETPLDEDQQQYLREMHEAAMETHQEAIQEIIQSGRNSEAANIVLENARVDFIDISAHPQTSISNPGENHLVIEATNIKNPDKTIRVDIYEAFDSLEIALDKMEALGLHYDFDKDPELMEETDFGTRKYYRLHMDFEDFSSALDIQIPDGVDSETIINTVAILVVEYPSDPSLAPYVRDFLDPTHFLDPEEESNKVMFWAADRVEQEQLNNPNNNN